ncbi:MAG: MscL family protein [Candidatus Pacearchaeota archaeon]|nr:MscL family protein [Candidatus Pacearchaeota archaeon]
MGLHHGFGDFLKEYKIIPMAIAFVIGLAAVTLVQSLVNNLIMPLITPFIPGGAWQTAILKLGPIAIGWGALLGAIINFVIIAFVVFIVAKAILKEDAHEKPSFSGRRKSK